MKTRYSLVVQVSTYSWYNLKNSTALWTASRDGLFRMGEKSKGVLSPKLSNKLANTVATRLHNDFVLRFTFSTCVHHDHSGEFENNLFKHLEELCRVGHPKTTSYHSYRDGQVERFNQTLLAMLGSLREKMKSNLSNNLNKVVQQNSHHSCC